MSEDIISLEGLLIHLDEEGLSIEQSPDEIYLSMNHQHLPKYVGGVIISQMFDTNESLKVLMNDAYVRNYRRFLGFRGIHLSSLANSGFLNSRYDLSFCFDVSHIFSQHNLVCDSELLMQLLLYGSSCPVDSLFKDRSDYEVGDEVILREVDLKKAKRALVYSKNGGRALEAHPELSDIPRLDLCDIREKAVESYFK